MCGIAGYVRSADRIDFDFRRMVDIMVHRGPDDSGVWRGELDGAEINFGHRRLSIIDLTPGGHQPMTSRCGRYVLIYNGELYNYIELRSELEARGCVFETRSDTEVFLQGLIEWGEDGLCKYNGMWAFALFDCKTGDLMLGRDRFGKKPLYYHRYEGTFLFASEIKSILAGAQHKFHLNLDVVKAYLEQNLLDIDNTTFFDGIHKVPAGHVARLNVRTLAEPVCSSYWHVTSEAAFEGSEDQLFERVRELFFDSVAIRLRSDVPVAVLLSGGLDSSAIVAAVKHLHKSDDILILSATSDNKQFDESVHIDEVARHLQLPVRKFNVDAGFHDTLKLLSDVVWHHDEPICNFSMLAHYLLMQKAKEFGVTVLLSGQGADEELCGYKKYYGFYLQSLLRRREYIEFLRSLYGLYRQGTVLRQLNLAEAKRYVSVFSGGKASVIGRALKEQAAGKIDLGLSGDSVIARQISDIYRFSVPVLTHYEDRNSMAFSREIRLPFLDYRLSSLLVQLPVQYKLRDGWTKWVFRKAMEPYLPRSITWRKDKQHFITPGGEMLKRTLKPQVVEYLHGDSLIFEHELVDRDRFFATYERFSRQRAERGGISFKEVFTLLALESWMRR